MFDRDGERGSWRFYLDEIIAKPFAKKIFRDKTPVLRKSIGMLADLLKIAAFVQCIVVVGLLFLHAHAAAELFH